MLRGHVRTPKMPVGPCAAEIGEYSPQVQCRPNGKAPKIIALGKLYLHLRCVNLGQKAKCLFLSKPKLLMLCTAVLLLLGSPSCKILGTDDGTDEYQNFTTRYNILFNGNKILEEVQRDRINGARENYQTLLPVFIDPTDAQANGAAYLMDSIIQKAYVVINKKERSRYVPDAYFMVARAHYEKGNYYDATELFRYVSQTMGDQNVKLKETAYSWRARTLIRTGRLSQAALAVDSALYLARQNGKSPTALTLATKTQWLLKEGKRAEAIPMLRQAIKAGKSKQERLRWQYLLAQLLESEGKLAEAYQEYNKLAKSNAAFELSFNAALRIESIESLQDPDPERHIQRLKRLVKNNKSRGFTDQIHYLIAQAYLAEGDSENAIKHFKLSAAESMLNEYQRTGSYLAIADLYLETGEYDRAKAYYDSTAMGLNSDYPSYESISEKITHVDELISHWNTITREDTLRMLGKLPVDEREAAIDSMLDERQKKQIAQQENRNSANNVMGTGMEGPILPNVLASDHFYFNNNEAISTGMNSFRRRWGNRQLQDNWRISDRSNLTTADVQDKPEGTEATSLGTSEALGVQPSLLSKADYLAAIPIDGEMVLQSDTRIQEAFFQIGSLYRDVLKDDEHAIASYLQLLKRYPQLVERDRVYYNLYRLYARADQTGEMERYKRQLLQEFPGSVYARSLLDPHYFARISDQKERLDSLYTEAYQAYTIQDLEKVIELADAVLTTNEEGSVLVQLAYLKALAIGRTDSLARYEAELRHILDHYQEDAIITPTVKQQLDFIQENREQLQHRAYAITEINASRERFENEPNMTRWPELVLHADGQSLIDEPKAVKLIDVTIAQNAITNTRDALKFYTDPANTTIDIKAFSENDVVAKRRTRDKGLLPDTAAYYFVVHVNNATANLSPSRYGIGQFNRGHLETKELRHQLKTVQNSSQLVYIGLFESYESIKAYADQIDPLMKDIMKIPTTAYSTFIITQKNLELLADENKINEYIDLYKEAVKTPL